MRNAHPDNGLFAEALDWMGHLLIPAGGSVGCDTNLSGVVEIGLPVDPQGPDGYNPVT